MSTIKNIAGLDQLAQALRELPAAVERKRLAKPVSDGAALIRDEAKSLAPVAVEVGKGDAPAGTLKAAILLAHIPGDRLTATYAVWVRHGKKFQHMGKSGANGDAFYWTFVEFGTSEMAAQPFMRPAYETRKNQALDVIIDGLRYGIDAEAALLSWSKPAPVV
jgi:HK97 gp10 family phage protein